MKIAITGSTGLVGSRIIQLLQNDYECIPISHDTLDITDSTEVNRVLSELDYDVFLHLAAYTNVDAAESEKNLAYSINVEGTKNVHQATTQKGKRFIYFSTDFVFDGTHPPYTEDSRPHPIGYYGQSKFEAEESIRDRATIIRISYPYGPVASAKPDFVQRIKSLLEQGKKLSMIADSTMTPTYIDDIAWALRTILNKPENDVYHVVGSQSISPFESGQMIAKHYGLPLYLIQSTTYDEYMKGKALRPRYSQMKSIRNTFQPMKNFEEGLTYCK